MAQEEGRNWYQSIHFDKLVCRKVFFFGPKGTPSREEHKTISSVLTTFTGALTAKAFNKWSSVTRKRNTVFGQIL